MKTFKLVSLQVIDQSNLKDIHLIDGLIINKENKKENWIIEAFIHRSYENFFKSLLDKKRTFTVQAVITQRENDPAPFSVSIRTINVMERKMNVVMKGRLLKSRNEYVSTIRRSI